jgi:serine O-acetyltransferase
VRNHWKVDLARYGGYRAFFREQSIYCIALYRCGRVIEGIKSPIIKKVVCIPYYIAFRLIETIFSTSMPKEVVIGKGLKIWHFGQIFINPDVVIGDNCTLRHGVTLGNKFDGGGSPKIGNNVEFGAHSMVLGNVKIGNNCIIGAMTLVNKDVPDNCIAIGVPAVIKQKSEKT